MKKIDKSQLEKSKKLTKAQKKMIILGIYDGIQRYPELKKWMLWKYLIIKFVNIKRMSDDAMYRCRYRDIVINLPKIEEYVQKRNCQLRIYIQSLMMHELAHALQHMIESNRAESQDPIIRGESEIEAELIGLLRANFENFNNFKIDLRYYENISEYTNLKHKKYFNIEKAVDKDYQLLKSYKINQPSEEFRKIMRKTELWKQYRCGNLPNILGSEDEDGDMSVLEKSALRKGGVEVLTAT